jgi:cation:H+ antiporter
VIIDALSVWTNGFIVLVTIVMVGLGASWLVDSAVRIAKRLKVSELIIGLTVVAFCTSAPEFAVTLLASFEHHGNISVGNIVGSNIFNLGFILGGCALIRSIPTSRELLRRDGVVLGATTILLFVIIGLDLKLDRFDGVLLFGLLLLYLGYLIRQGRQSAMAGGEEDNQGVLLGGHSLFKDITLLVVGLVAIIGGSHLLVNASVALARSFGLSEWVIGVTIVAAGTSAPEFATALAGVIKGRYALSIGNIIGSDIFNLLGVLGLAGILRPLTIDPMARISLAALCGMVFLVLIFMRTGWRIYRLEGLALIAVALLRWGFDFATHQ